MIKKLKPAILFLMFVLLVQEINGQMPINVTADLSQRFLNYTQSVPREEIYIHSDRKDYISGEDLWFNIYLIDRQSLKPSARSKIAYFELLNSENRPVVQKKILLEGGFGPGQVTLPDTLSTGIYTIRAYTNWMKNFLPENCFSGEIHIYNTFSTKKSKNRIISDKLTEGTRSYKDSGLALTVNYLKSDNLEISILADQAYRAKNSSQFYLFIQTHGIINRVSSEILTEGVARISIPKSQMTAGINQITIFNSDGKPVAERYIFTPLREKNLVEMHCDDSTGCRKKMSVDLIFSSGKSFLHDASDISISVSPITNEKTIPDLTDYNIFGSEFGPIDWDRLRFKKTDNISPEVMDSLLQTVKSNWIDWRLILSDELPALKYPAEIEDHFVTGKLSSGAGSDSGKLVIMSIPGKIAGFQYARTDRNGNFSFKVPITMETYDLVIQPDEVLKNQTVVIETPYSDKYYKTIPDTTNMVINEEIVNLGVNHQVRKIYAISYAGDTIYPSFPDFTKLRFYGKPDQELIMEDYITLPVMQEVFFELLMGVFLKTKKSGYKISMNDLANNTLLESTPGLFVDGVMVKDESVIAAIDPETVEKIDVVRQKYFVGNYLFYGIVNIITKAGDFSNVDLPDYAIRLPYKVIDPEILFRSTDYSAASKIASRVPDFRNTLYWNASIKADKEGKASVEFWTSDFRSDFEVNIQGISPDGNAFSLRKIIKVNK